MEGFTYETRKKLTDQWVAAFRERGSGLEEQQRRLLPERDDGYIPHKSCQWIGETVEREGKSLSWFYKTYLPALVDLCVGKDYEEEFYYALDQMNQFQMTAGWYRRSLRSEGYGPFARRSVALLWAYSRLNFYGCTLAELLTGRAGAELYDHARTSNWSYGGILAAQIDRENRETAQAVRDILLGEGNTAMTSYELIRGIVMSRSREFYELLGKFLLAARLQEGVRQAVCETMDAGRPEAFLYLFGVIEDNGLVRYSSVKRAVSTWIGIFSEKSTDRITDKLVRLMGRCLREPAFCQEQLKTNDSIAISCGLWAKGFYNAGEAVKAELELIRTGTKNQKMTASYFNQSLQDARLRMQAAKEVLLQYPEDLELAACFMPGFMADMGETVNRLLWPDQKKGTYIWSRQNEAAAEPARLPLSRYFDHPQEAIRLYGILKGLLKAVPSKGLDLNPCIFPWHRVVLTRSQIAARLCLTAWMLQEDAYLDEAAQWIPLVGQGEYYGGMSRAAAARLLLYRPGSRTRRQMIFDLLHNPEEYTRRAAVRLAEALALNGEDYEAIEKKLKYKSGRESCLALLERQDSRAACVSVSRLLAAQSEECHMGALELALRVKERDREGFEPFLPVLKGFEHPTERERVLLEELTGQDSRAQDILSLPGYGLYNPGAVWALPQIRTGRTAAAGLFSWGDTSCIQALKRLDRLIEENQDREYQPAWGDPVTLGARLTRIQYVGGPAGSWTLEAYPFKELWSGFYEREIKTPDRLIELYLYLCCRARWQEYQRFSPLYKKVFGSGLLKKPPFKREETGLRFPGHIRTLVAAMLSQYVSQEDRLRWALAGGAALFAAAKELPREGLTYEEKVQRWDRTAVTVFRRITGLPIFAELLDWLKTDGEEWRESFAIRFGIDRLYREREEKPESEQTQGYVTLADFVCCAVQGLWDRDMFLKAAFEYGCMGTVIGAASTVCQRGCLSSRQVDIQGLRAFFGKDAPQPSDGKYRFDQAEVKTPKMELAQELYHLIVPALLKVELRRGEKATPFSAMAMALYAVYGIDSMIQVLVALGDEPLKRANYWRGMGTGRQTVLCRILKVSYPAAGETAADLKKALKGKKISKKRLVELAMYAPQWIPMLEEYLAMAGLKSGCYYFMAHTSERLDEQAVSTVAKYTPLSPEELLGGAFDVNWFFEAYHALGEENFKLLYDAAKYSSSGTAHARARKYADAALGKADFEKLKAEIEAKRNKDLLMSIGLLPLKEEREARERQLLERYQFIERFRRESRRFGAQRRASEGRACDLALGNLSVKAGFSDSSRLVLRMEARLSKETEVCFQWLSLDKETRIRVEVDKEGRSRLACEKAGKALKALPARFKKEERVLEYQAAAKALKEQYSRTCQMMERAMEEGTVFEVWELLELMESPVVRPILAPLVFGLVSREPEGREERLPEAMGFLTREGLRDENGVLTALSQEAFLIAVHPYHLYQAGRWHEFQRLLFQRQIRQPFKQVFRELYVKLEEEKDKAESRMFAGNQIQPQKTVGALRGRRWVADYEDGLQKVYYRENIVARLYAMADWFSPSDIEAPTLEYVAFEDRKTFQPVKISQVPEILYSEVMRDVDLAVSVAHAGGVDPEASHSTVELRRAVVECSLELFGIGNVRLEGSHAYIQGRLGRYTVHLGSGVVHQSGNAMLYVVPVHSQHRGRLFLPFMDEDPKTAEILSKILLFAEDDKIRDPKILAQIR